MASPDFSQYVDLTIYDKDPGQIYLDAIDYAQRVALPEFNPRVGSIEDALLQAVAYATSELSGAINRLPDGLLEGILNLYGFERQQSISARLTLDITLVDDAGGTVPAGALFSQTLEGENGLETFFFATVADVVVPQGETTETVEAEALTVGVIPAIDNGTEMTPVSGTSRVLSAVTVGTMVQGENEETNISYFTRAAAFLASRSDALATSIQMQNYLTTYLVEIQRSYISDLTVFKYMRVSSISRTGDTVTASVQLDDSDWAAYQKNLTFFFDDIEVDITRIICRFVDDSATEEKINGTALTGAKYIVTSKNFNPVSGIFTLTFRTDMSTDAATIYLPASNAPHNFHDTDSVEPLNDKYIEILITPDDFNEHPGGVGLVFGDSDGLPIQNTAYGNVQNAVEAKSVAGLKFTSIPPLLIPVTVSAQVEHAPTFGAVAVREAVEAAIEQYLSPSQWKFGARIYKNSLIGLASTVNGVARIVSLTLSIGTGNFSDLANYVEADGGYIEFAYPFCLPDGTATVTGIV